MMDYGVGHYMVTAICNTFVPTSTYEQSWENGKRSDKWRYSYVANASDKFNGTTSVVPEKVNYNNFSESDIVFT